MKIYTLILLSLLISIQGQTQDKVKKFTVKSGKIIYQYTGVNSGTKTIYFDDYGEKYYEHEKFVNETSIFGQTSRTETNHLTIMVNDQFWNIDYINKNYTRGTLAFYKETHEMYADKTDAEIQQMNEDIIASFGGEKLGQEKILGRTCDKIKLMGSVIWVYKGITLKLNTNVMGITAGEIATSFDENIQINSSRFQAPQDIQYTNVDQQSDMFNQDESYDDTDENLYPVSYPYEQFKKAIQDFNPEGYTRMMMTQDQGQYAAIYSRGFTNMISVMAMSEENIKQIPKEELKDFKNFSHEGKTLRYGSLKDDDMNSKALLIPYKEHQMYIMIISAPGKDKETMTKWAHQLKF